MDRIDEMRAFLAVADARSFVQGARRLGVSPAQASKLVARLEDRLHARLLNRTTRDVSLTDVGYAYLERARGLIDELEGLETSVRDTARGPRGRLKVAAPVTFGAGHLGPLLLDFATAYPDVGLEVSFSDRTVNLVDEGFDVAVRIVRMGDTSLVARKLAETRIVCLASPSYLIREGRLSRPAEMAAREAIIDLNMKEPFVWTFGTGKARVDVRVQGRLRFSSAEACVDAAIRGFGVARAPDFVAAEAVRSGKLIPILCEFEPEPLPIQAVYPHARHLAAKVRVFVDFLAERFSGDPEWRRGWAD
jgi:DNA-binding transcriptional LysR family regulator